jgi:hypothetical protein
MVVLNSYLNDQLDLIIGARPGAVRERAPVLREVLYGVASIGAPQQLDDVMSDTSFILPFRQRFYIRLAQKLV